MLFSALHCLLVEIHSGLYTGELPDSAKLSELARADDIPFITKYHPLPNDLLEKLELLWQVRHEIVHPSPRPSGETNNTPSYLVRLRQEGLFQSTGRDADYPWMFQLQSHKLFAWAFDVVKDTVEVLLRQHQVPDYAANGLRRSYARRVQDRIHRIVGDATVIAEYVDFRAGDSRLFQALLDGSLLGGG